MAYAKTRTAVVVAILAAIPIALQWNENRNLKRELAIANGESIAGASGKSARGHDVEQGRGTAAKAGRVQLSEAAGRSEQRGAVGWQEALSVQDPVRRSQRIAELLASLDASSAPGIAELFFGEGVEGIHEREAGLFLRAWAQMDGAATIAYLESKDQAKSASSYMQAALGGWASQDPEAARSWAEAVEDGNVREDLLFGVIDGWTLVDFNAAADYAETRPRSGARTRFVELLFERSLAAGGISGAQAWYEGISTDDHNKVFRLRAFERIAATMVRRDPSAAANWIAEQAREISVSRETVEAAAKRLAETSPEEALRWISSLPTLGEGVISGSMGGVFADWAGKEMEAAGDWLSANGDHPEYATLARGYSSEVARVDTAGALEWARSIEDDGQRQAAEIGVAERRIKADGDAALAELRLAGLTEDQIKQATQAAQTREIRGITFTGGGTGQLQFRFSDK